MIYLLFIIIFYFYWLMYSINHIGTLKRPNRIKLDNGYDLNYTYFVNKKHEYMERNNFFYMYALINSQSNFRRFDDNIYEELK